MVLPATTAQPGTLADKYRSTATDAGVRWREPSGQKVFIPGEAAKMSDISTLCEQVCGVIHSGLSVAVAAGYKVDTAKVVNAKEAAKREFTFQESAMYHDWENGLDMGTWDFSANASTDPISDAKLKRFSRIAAALKILYKTGSITPTQAKGWTTRNQALMPICRAQCKILKAERDAAEKQDGVHPKELLEKRVLRRIQGLIGRRRNAWGVAWRKLNAEMSEGERCIRLRMSQLENGGKGTVRKAAPLHHTVRQTYRSMRCPRARNLAELAKGKRTVREMQPEPESEVPAGVQEGEGTGAVGQERPRKRMREEAPMKGIMLK